MVERESHVYKWELGGLAQLSGLQVRTLDGGDRGIPTPEQVRNGYVEEDAHRPGSGLLTLENTHNSKGGVAIDPEKIDAAAEAAHDLGLPVHLDGARVLNAAVARDVSPERMTERVDSVMFCLSKGLGAPVGSMLAGSEEFIARARRNRKLFGGGMRQAGIVAGPGLLALENVERLDDDHENARVLAERLASVEGLSVQDPETNIVLVNTEDAGLAADEFLDLCEEAGVQGVEFDTHVARFCTHWDVDREDVEEAAERVGEAVGETN
jgi:threonine aldolase